MKPGLLCKVCVWAGACSFFGQAVVADELTDPMAVINKMVEAAKSIHGVSYRVEVVPSGMALQFMPQVKATCLIEGFADGMPAKARLELEVKKGDDQEVTRRIAGIDGEDYYLIDHQEKMAYKDIEAGVYGSSRGAVRAAVLEDLVTDKDPFKQELESKKQELRPAETVDGRLCYALHLTYDEEGTRTATLYVDQKEFLMRKLDFTFKSPQGEGGLLMTVSDLKINPKFKSDAFKFKLPEGYTLSDDFAP